MEPIANYLMMPYAKNNLDPAPGSLVLEPSLRTNFTFFLAVVLKGCGRFISEMAWTMNCSASMANTTPYLLTATWCFTGNVSPSAKQYRA
ncbi:hypothetical protein PoB_006878200 [Plakobranchus ocellatus]|uniref:Uncharacterized protein n=1 Tax=Plakobranchus ocellatus TaxID=259542 RepID=A0AAV4DE02_9GAST|nr:hypothetical protein PoB_006878200 [Plakobranchus ocellatus]